jgi:enediyne biosynthesis protein E7
MDLPDSTKQPNSGSVKRRLPPTPTSNLRELIRSPLSFFNHIASEYGDVVCYRPAPDPAILVNHPDYIRHVLVDNNRNYTKATYSNLAFNKVVGEGLLTSEGETWRKQRRMMQPAFHHKRIEAMDEMIVHATQTMLTRWQRSYEAGQPLNVANEMAALTVTITTRALFGIDLGDEVLEIGEIVNRAASYLEKPSNPLLIKSAGELAAVVDRIIQQRKYEFKDGGDLLSSMIQTKDEKTGTEMDNEQLRNQIMTLMLAGYETTASALSWTWYLLSQNLWAMEKLKQEVSKKLEGRAPKYADVENMPYSRMIFSESMRLFPPAWTLGRRAIGEDEIGGYYIAPNAVIAICIYTVHRHPQFWDNPEIFDPERFSPANSTGRHKFAYIPFGAGPRQCIGNYLGLMEASLVIATIAQRFELHLVPGIDVQPQAVFVLRPSREMLMSLHPYQSGAHAS